MKTNTVAAMPVAVTAEGATAFSVDTVQKLRRSVLSNLLFEDQYYEDGESIADRIRTYVLQVKPEQAAEIAIEARTRFKLRHVPLLIARALASGNAAQKAVVPELLYQIIQRPDELAEFLALYWKDGKVPIASCVKRGLAKAFTKFDAYSLARYNQDNPIRLRDVLFLVHAKPRDEKQAEIWKQLVSNTLPTPDTWESELSASKDKAASWNRLLDEKKLGALALLRNLRNMKQAGIEEGKIAEAISTMKVDRVLPFRFIAASRYIPSLENVLEMAMFRCMEGAEKMPGRTALVVDVSGSMASPLSQKSDMTRFEAAAALAILCREVCEEAKIFVFNTEVHEIPARRGFALRDAMAKYLGGGTKGQKAVLAANNSGYDRIIVITDGQWDGSVDYSKVCPDALPHTGAYLINIAAYQNSVGNKKWVLLDGWSEAILTYVQACEEVWSTVRK